MRLAGALENHLCWRHSPEPTFELQVENPSDVLANFGIAGGSLEAPGAPENGAPVYAPASFGRKNSSAVYAPWAVVPKASQNTAWNGGSGQLDQMSRALGPVSDPRFRPRHRRSRLRGLGGLPQTPSAVYAKTRFGAPVYAPRGVLKNDARVRVLGLVLEPLGPPKTAPQMGQDNL